MKVLIVDDQIENSYLLQSLLEGYKHEVILASNGKIALDVLLENPVDLVISDILMPTMDGFTLCREIRKTDKLKNIPFIAYTATYTGPKDEELAMQLGVNAFIIKPCEPLILMQIINEVMEAAQRGEINFPSPSITENVVLKLYNERLVRKLEQKMLEAENEVIARRQAMVALERSEELLKATQKISKIGGWEWDVEKKLIYWTEELYRIHDMDPVQVPENAKNLINKSLECYSEADRKYISRAFIRCLKYAEPFVIERWITTKQGRELYVRSSGKPVVENGKLVKIYGDFQDLTERKNAEKEQSELQEQLRQAQKLDSIGQLAGGVAHDFNNILTVILGTAEDLQERLLPADPIAKDLEEIIKAGRRGANLTRQLLTFSRKHVIKVQLVNLNNLLEDMQKMLLRLIREDVQIEIVPDKELGLIKADLGHIEQIILNLIINAREAMPVGGKIKVETSNFFPDEAFILSNSEIQPARYVSLKVSDTGIGMDENTLKHLFDPFFTTKEKQKGTGLGLSTVYGIVRNLKGYIKVNSKLGKGTTFTVLLPQSDDSPDNMESEDAFTEDKPKPKLVMIIDDDPYICGMTGKMVAKLGFQVITALSGKEAMEKIESENLLPNLVITDVVMPGLNGFEFLALLRAKQPAIQAIVISGYTAKAIEQYGKLDPETPFIQKPFSRAELEEAILRALG